jgi:hypothetical protein
MSANVSAGAILLICALYAVKHRGSDWPGMVLGACLGNLMSHSTFAPLLDAITNVIVGIVQAVIDALNHWSGGGSGGGGGTSPQASPGVILRYHLALITGR